MMHRLLCWLAYRLQDRLLEDTLNANAELRRAYNTQGREIRALQWRLRYLDPDGTRLAAHILHATRPYRADTDAAAGWGRPGEGL